MSSHDLLQNYLPAVVVVKFKNPALHEQALVSEEYEVDEASQVASQVASHHRESSEVPVLLVVALT